VECYHGIDIEPSKSSWPSQYNCADFEEACRCCDSRNVTDDDALKLRQLQPRSISLSDINLADPEWNELTGSIDGSLMGLFKLGERGED
jgi:hypothetical protein